MASQTAVTGEGIRPSHSKGLCPIVKAGDFVFLRGETGRDPETNEIVSPDVKDQTRQILNNISTMLKAAGGSLNDIVSATVFLADIKESKLMGEVWTEFFQECKPGPARCTVQVTLGGITRVEIQSIAYLK
jgi:2-iminobutanoate/2-iminopropanoate deaminase